MLLHNLVQAFGRPSPSRCPFQESNLSELECSSESAQTARSFNTVTVGAHGHPPASKGQTSTSRAARAAFIAMKPQCRPMSFTSPMQLASCQSQHRFLPCEGPCRWVLDAVPPKSGEAWEVWSKRRVFQPGCSSSSRQYMVSRWDGVSVRMLQGRWVLCMLQNT